MKHRLRFLLDIDCCNSSLHATLHIFFLNQINSSKDYETWAKKSNMPLRLNSFTFLKTIPFLK